MDSQPFNAHIQEWRKASLFYQIGIGLSLTLFTLIVILWIVIEIINVKRRKLISLERQKHQMDGVKITQKLNEINNKSKVNNKPQNKPLLQTVVINNMNRNYKLTKISNTNNNNEDNEQMSKLTEHVEMTDICDKLNSP